MVCLEFTCEHVCLVKVVLCRRRWGRLRFAALVYIASHRSHRSHWFHLAVAGGSREPQEVVSTTFVSKSKLANQGSESELWDALTVTDSRRKHENHSGMKGDMFSSDKMTFLDFVDTILSIFRFLVNMLLLLSVLICCYLLLVVTICPHFKLIRLP